MRRTWLAALLVCGLPALAQTVPAGGVYVVDFQVRLGQQVPAGALVTCKVHVQPQGSATVQTVVAAGTVQGASAHCAVQIPSTGLDAAALTYEIDAAAPAGTLLRTAAGTAPGLPRPPAGGAARLNLNLTL